MHSGHLSSSSSQWSHSSPLTSEQQGGVKAVAAPQWEAELSPGQSFSKMGGGVVRGSSHVDGEVCLGNPEGVLRAVGSPSDSSLHWP